MSKHLRTLLLAGIMAFFMAGPIVCHAIPAKHNRLTITQPDGSSVTLLFKGDEYFKVTTTADGSAVSLCSDGYVRYVTYEDGKRTVTDYIVNGDDVPADVISASKDIPYAELTDRAKERRRQYTDIRMQNMMTRNSTPLAGTDSKVIRAAVILVEFQDVRFTQGNLEKFDALLNEEGYSYNGATGSARDYFKAQYGDLADFHFDVYGIFTAPKNREYYGGNDWSGNDKHPDELVAEACKALDGQIDFSQYDVDGDRVCDFVFMFFAGEDEAQTYIEDCIWSHAWAIDYYDPYLYLDGVRISSYACSSELKTGWGGNSFASIGTFCHEFSHIMGLMDAYDTNYNYDGYLISETLWGVTSIMDSGSYNNDSNTPPNYNAFEREMLGIATPVELKTGNMTLEPINESNKFLRIESDTEDEYFLVEYRKQEGWDAYLPTSGLLAYHIDKSDNPAGESYNYGYSVTAAERWPLNEVNAYPYHQCADLIEACNNTTTKDVSDVFFPGRLKVDMLSSETHEAYKTWSGKEVEYQLRNIESTGDHATFMLVDKASLELPVITGHETTVIGQEATISWTIDRETTDATAQAELRFKDGDTVSVQEVQGYEITFEDLEPGTEYTVSIWYSKDELESARYAVDFTTFDRTSDFPYIYLDRAAFVKGATVRLMLLNLDDDDASVQWYISDQAIADPDNFTVDFDGQRTLKAIVTYANGIQECIMTTVTPAQNTDQQ